MQLFLLNQMIIDLLRVYAIRNESNSFFLK